MRQLLLISCCLFGCPAHAQETKQRVLKLNNAALFDKLMTGLDARQLLHTYRSNLKVLQVQRNHHEPAVRNSIL